MTALLSESPGLAVVLVASLLIAAAGLFVGWSAIRGRRRMAGDVRDIVEALEHLRSGRARPRFEVSATSPMGVVADAVHRLGHDLNARWSEAETAAERWRALIDASGDVAVITTDNDGDIRSFSGGAQALFGWDEGEVLSRPAAVVFDESSYKDLLPKLARRSLRQQGIQVECKLLRRDGSSFDAEVSVRGLMSPSAHPLGFMMVVRDITEQVRMARELRESEERYRGLVEGLADGVVIVREGRVVYTNPAAERLCGCSPKELHGTPWRDRVETEEVLVTEEILSELEGQPAGMRELQSTLVGRHGASRADVRIQASSVRFDGSPAVLLLIRDETGERRIEAELRRNESRLDAVLEATSDGILVLSDDGRAGAVQMTNAAFASLFDLRVQDVLGLSEQRLVGMLRERGDGAGRIADWIDSRRSQPSRMHVTVEGQPPRELQVTTATLTGRDGRSLGRVLACHDVTDLRRSEREMQQQNEVLEAGRRELEQSHRRLAEVNDKLKLRGEELAGLNQELRRLDEMKSNLLGNVSHELQTPLVSIRGYTEMILKERLGPINLEQRKGLELSLKNIDRLIAMIDNLLAFNRNDPGLAQLTLSSFPLVPLVHEVVELLQAKIVARGIQVSVSIDDEGLEIYADRDKALQVLLNLLTNAVKFNRDKGRIEISAHRGRSGYATVRIRDTGRGIPVASLGRIFERSYQVRPAEPGGESGSGIGLSIVRDILRLHGCTIQVDSREDAWTEFTFTLPLAEKGRTPAARQSPAEAAVPPEPVENPPAPPPIRPRLRIIRPGGKTDITD